MKKITCCKLILISILTILFAAAFYNPPASVGVLTKIIKQVDYKPYEVGNWDEAKLGSVLNDGDEIKTGDRSLALIKFLDNSLLRVRENSIVTILGSKEESRINKTAVIQEGSVGFEIEEQGEGEFKFTTPTAVASIRGTDGYFEVEKISTLLFVGSGAVEIQPNEGNRQSGVVQENQVAVVDAQGKLEIRAATDNEKKKFNAISKENVKQIKLRTESGEEYIIEYLD